MTNKKDIEKRVSAAIDEIPKEFPGYKDSGLPKELNGYISSFGASIIQSGLIPAVAFYERAETNSGNDKTAKNRKKIMRIIGKLIGYDLSDGKTLLLEKLIEEDTVNNKKKEIINSAIALKLAIRVYKQEGPDNQKGSDDPKSGDEGE